MANDVLNEVTVYLSDSEAEQFILFRKYYDVFSILTKKKVFDQKGAAITLHFDASGVLKNVTRSDVLYDSRVDFINLN
jgi:hypothetical protein